MVEKNGSFNWMMSWQAFGVTSLVAVVVGVIMITLGWQSGQRSSRLPPATTNPAGIQVTGTSLGTSDAPVVIIEYSDFQCRYCQDFALDIAPRIEAAYVKTGKVRIEYRHVIVLGAESQLAAEAAECAAEQNQFWPFYNNLMWRQYSPDLADITVERLREIARQIGLDMALFNASLASGKFKEKVARDDIEGRAWGITGIPAFFVNDVLADSKVKGNFALFSEIIDAELARLVK